MFELCHLQSYMFPHLDELLVAVRAYNYQSIKIV